MAYDGSWLVCEVYYGPTKRYYVGEINSKVFSPSQVGVPWGSCSMDNEKEKYILYGDYIPC